MSSFRSRSFLLTAILYGIIALICTRLPLLNYLGYEFSAAFGLLAAFGSGLRTIGHLRRASFQSSASSTERVRGGLSSFVQVLVSNAALLFIPFVIAAANAFFVKNCSLPEGVAFFALIPVVSVWAATALGFFCAVHYRFAKTLFVVFVGATLFYSAALGYFTPAIFSYNFFYGYFPGLTYDEALSISRTLVVFRLITIVVGGLFVAMASMVLWGSNAGDATWMKGIQLIRSLAAPRYRWWSAGVVFLLVVLYVTRGPLGIESNRRYIQRQLGAVLETEHFTIYYTPGSYSADEIRWIGAEHEFRLHRVLSAFSLQFRGKIESYIYPSSESKQRLIGTGTTNIAKPWSGQVHVTKQSLDRTLEHELVHVVAAPFGFPVIRASLSTGLVEGLAMAVDWDWGTRTLHQYAAGMRKFGLLPDIKQLMLLTGFASNSSSVSYVVAGSFCKYLIDRYGMRRMTQLYRTLDYNAVYGRSLEELMNEWQGFLGRLPVNDNDRNTIDALFRHPPIFRKVCARVLGERNLLAGKKFSGKEFSAAALLYKQSYDEGHGKEALNGYLSSSLRARDFSALTSALDTIVQRDSLPAQYMSMFVNIGMAFWALGEYDIAQELFRKTETTDFSEGSTEAALVCSFALKDTANRAALLKYFLDPVSDTLRVSLLDSMVQHPRNHWLPIYLKGKALIRLQRYEDALNVMRHLDPGVPPSRLEAIRLRTIGYALFRLKRFEEAKASFWISLNSFSSAVAHNEVDEWIDRCTWISEHGLE